jgi:hypothetical protein
MLKEDRAQLIVWPLTIVRQRLALMRAAIEQRSSSEQR